jgi:hypothetical protein
MINPLLVAGTEAGAIIAMEVLVKQEEIAPVRVLLKLAGSARLDGNRVSRHASEQENARETSTLTGQPFWRRSLPIASNGPLPTPFGEQGLPEAPLVLPIQLRSHSLKLTQGDRVAAPHGRRQKQYRFLQVGRQPA